MSRPSESRSRGVEKGAGSRHGVERGDGRTVERLGVRVIDPSESANVGAEATAWLDDVRVSKLLVHFDLDVLDPARFRAQLFNNPDGLAERYAGQPTGTMTFDRVIDLLDRASGVADVVALGITEHPPWDAENLRRALARLPILNQGHNNVRRTGWHAALADRPMDAAPRYGTGGQA